MKTVIVCPVCGKEKFNFVKKRFISNEYRCSNCDYLGDFPKRTSSLIFFWTITVLDLYIIIQGIQGSTNGSIGILGLVAPIYLISSWRANKKIEKYRIDKGLKEFPYPKEKNGIVKGIIFAIIAIIITFALGLLTNYTESGYNNAITQSSGTVANNEWENYASIDGKFSILTPATPSKEVSAPQKTNGISMTYTSYSFTDTNNDEYMVAVYDYDISPSNFNSKNGIEGSINGFINSIDGAKLTSSSYTMFQGYQAGDFIGSYNNVDSVIKGRTFYKDDSSTVRGYLIVGMGNNGSPTNYLKILNSFKLLK